MKKLSLTSVVIVFAFSLCYPMGPMVHCGSMNQNELSDLACYCCSETDKTCSIFASCGCNHHNGPDHSLWLCDTLVSMFALPVLHQRLHLESEESVVLKTMYCEVPYKPPKS
jgi:hypothetical protein